MLKKLICCCLLVLFAFPVPAYASFSDDVAQFEDKYSDIYDNIDPAITAKMESYLEDVVDYTVNNYDAGKDMNVQVKNAAASVLLTGSTYKYDLLPFMAEQSANKDAYQDQLSEMMDIVSNEVESRLNPPAPPVSPTDNNGGQDTDQNSSQDQGQSQDNSNPTPVVTPAKTFLDVTNHWAAANINTLVSAGAINGYPDNSFKPDNTITRAEFAALLVKAFNLTPKTGKIFADTAGHWAKDYIATANAYGILNGISDTNFAPDTLITREQMAVMIVQAADLKEAAGGKTFTDADKISSWARDAVQIAVQNGIISGYGDNTFNPGGKASRAEAVTVIINALK